MTLKNGYASELSNSPVPCVFHGWWVSAALTLKMSNAHLAHPHRIRRTWWTDLTTDNQGGALLSDAYGMRLQAETSRCAREGVGWGNDITFVVVSGDCTLPPCGAIRSGLKTEHWAIEGVIYLS
jgi:hypothetical protein